MRKLFVKEENRMEVEVDYKALYESAMQEVAKLQEELEDWQDYCADKEIEIAHSHTRIELYERLLKDVDLAYLTNEDGASFEEIVAEFNALLENKTTGYKYCEDEDLQAILLYGYELINKNEEETNMKNEKVNRIVKLLEGDYPMEIVDELLPVLGTYREDDFYMPNDEDGLQYILEYVYNNDLYAFACNLSSDDYNSDYPYINLYQGRATSATLAMVRDDLLAYVTSEDCTDEILDEIVERFDELELW